MKLSVQVVLHADEGTETVVHEVFHLDRGPLTPDSLGLGLAEAKDLLAAVQSVLVIEQVNAGVATWVAQGQTHHRRTQPVRHPAPT
jgi:hypothetical protein